MIQTLLLTVPLLAVSVNAANEIDVPPPIITDTLQAMMEENTDEATRVAIWLKDIDTDERVEEIAENVTVEKMDFYEDGAEQTETATVQSPPTSDTVYYSTEA